MVIGGSGPSLRRTDHRRVPADAPVVRVNNFFLEDRYYLGRVIDRVYFSGDPRAIRFYLATLRKVMRVGEYEVRGSVSHQASASRHHPPEPFHHFEVADPEIHDLVQRHWSTTAILPSSGVLAMVQAVAAGATALLLTGIDFYEGEKYAFPPPPRLARLLAPNLNPVGYDTRLHALEVDLEVIQVLRERGITIERLSEADEQVLDLRVAPVLPPGSHLPPPAVKAAPTEDWVRWSGLWSIDALVGLRWLRRAARFGPRRAQHERGADGRPAL